MHPEALEAVRRMVNVSGYINAPHALNEETDRPRKRHGLDLGGADVNGTARSIVPYVDRWYGLDIAEGEGVDLVADATNAVVMSTYHEMFDVVLCTELLEHVEAWSSVVENAWSVLAPGGFAFFTFAGTSRMAGWGRRPHGARGDHDVPDGEHYGNVEHMDFLQVVREVVGPQFTPEQDRWEVWTRPVPGDIYCWFRK